MSEMSRAIIEQTLLEIKMYGCDISIEQRIGHWENAFDRMITYVADVVREYPDMEQPKATDVRTLCEDLAKRLMRESTVTRQ